MLSKLQELALAVISAWHLRGSELITANHRLAVLSGFGQAEGSGPGRRMLASLKISPEQDISLLIMERALLHMMSFDHLAGKILAFSLHSRWGGHCLTSLSWSYLTSPVDGSGTYANMSAMLTMTVRKGRRLK